MNETTKISMVTENGAARVACAGELDLYISDEFGAILAEAVAATNNVVIDMRDVDFIDSAILQSLSVYGKRLYSQGSRMRVLVSEGGYPGSVLKTVGFDCLMDVVVEGTD